jgi:hypothetical protein
VGLPGIPRAAYTPSTIRWISKCFDSGILMLLSLFTFPFPGK